MEEVLSKPIYEGEIIKVYSVGDQFAFNLPKRGLLLQFMDEEWAAMRQELKELLLCWGPIED